MRLGDPVIALLACRGLLDRIPDSFASLRHSKAAVAAEAGSAQLARDLIAQIDGTESATQACLAVPQPGLIQRSCGRPLESLAPVMMAFWLELPSTTKRNLAKASLTTAQLGERF